MEGQQGGDSALPRGDSGAQVAQSRVRGLGLGQAPESQSSGSGHRAPCGLAHCRDRAPSLQEARTPGESRATGAASWSLAPLLPSRRDT